MKTRIIVAAVLLPLFLVVLLFLPPVVLTFVISAICAIATYELFAAFKIINKRVLVYAIIAAVLTPMAIYLSHAFHIATNSSYSVLTAITLLLSIFFIFISWLLIEFILTFKSKKADQKGTRLMLKQVPVALAAGMLIPLLLSSLISLKCMPYGYLFVLLPIVITVMTDSGAYFVGITMGKTKAFPIISPNKTVEGCIGGVITGTAGLLIYGIILSYATSLTIVFPALILYGILGSVIAQLGDLTFSLIKRKCEIKDYGKIMPGHGGALDRFDSMILCAPAVYLLVILVPAVIF